MCVGVRVRQCLVLRVRDCFAVGLGEQQRCGQRRGVAVVNGVALALAICFTVQQRNAARDDLAVVISDAVARA